MSKNFTIMLIIGFILFGITTISIIFFPNIKTINIALGIISGFFVVGVFTQAIINHYKESIKKLEKGEDISDNTDIFED